uniref:Uncharacterized protein n=2 Tax=gambiae species complex TaxID=44542 RepID=A0A499FSQ0_ANOAR
MFIFLLFASDGCRNVCQIFSQRLVARLRKHRRKREDGSPSPTSVPPSSASSPPPPSPRWTACLRTWIKCVCAGSCSVAATATTTSEEHTRAGGWGTVAKLLFHKLLHQA